MALGRQVRLPAGSPRPVTLWGTAVLHQPCRPVEAFDADLKTLVADMIATMRVAQGVGLAANQVGVDLRVFVYDCPDGDGVRQAGHVVNPQLRLPETDPTRSPAQLLREGVLDREPEGCLSVPGPHAALTRPAVAWVVGQDLRGRRVRVRGTGLLARCLQHECDHLDGTLFVDRLDEQPRTQVLDTLRETVTNGTLPTWSAGPPQDVQWPAVPR